MRHWNPSTIHYVSNSITSAAKEIDRLLWYSNKYGADDTIELRKEVEFQKKQLRYHYDKLKEMDIESILDEV